MTTKSRTPDSACRPNSGTSTRSTGNTVCAPALGGRSSLPIWGSWGPPARRPRGRVQVGFRHVGGAPARRPVVALTKTRGIFPGKDAPCHDCALKAKQPLRAPACGRPAALNRSAVYICCDRSLVRSDLPRERRLSDGVLESTLVQDSGKRVLRVRQSVAPIERPPPTVGLGDSVDHNQHRTSCCRLLSWSLGGRHALRFICPRTPGDVR